jgi:UPF0716 family protein affecting phage T7 exclusion
MHTGNMWPIWFLLEFLLFIKLISLYGFLYIFAWYTLPSFIGFLILSYYPKALLGSLQATIQNKEKPSSKMLHSLFIIISAFFFIIPTASTRIIALFLFLPILRHIIVFILLWQWYKFAGKIFGKFQNFNFSSNGFAVYTNFYRRGGFNKKQTPFDSSSTEVLDSYDEREVIDVTPKQVDTKPNDNK